MNGILNFIVSVATTPALLGINCNVGIDFAEKNSKYSYPRFN